MKAAPAPDPCRTSRAAFTLVELLLATALLLLLFSALAFNFSSAQSGSELITGTETFESLIRFARAQAAHSGRRVQIRFQPDSSQPLGPTLFRAQLAWEPDPLAQPGVFVEFDQVAWNLEELNRLVGVQHVFLPGTSLSREQEAELSAPLELEDVPEVEAAPPDPITFAPDGTSDSAHIHLAARVEEDPRSMIIFLSGVTGAFYHELLEPTVALSPEPRDAGLLTP